MRFRAKPRKVTRAMSNESINKTSRAFDDAEWYDRTINWSARLSRELPVLVDVFGPPGGEKKLLDAGCGTGRQARALAEKGYRVVGIDQSAEMLVRAEELAAAVSAPVRFVRASYAEIHEAVGGGFDGLYCLGNALSAAGSKDAVRTAVAQFSRSLRPGGRVVLQVLNYPPMRSEVPCVRGPRVSKVDGREYLSVRQFHFEADGVQVTNITVWHDGIWRQRAHAGRLYPVTLDELRAWMAAEELRIEAEWGSYARDPFDREKSTDLLLVAMRL